MKSGIVKLIARSFLSLAILYSCSKEPLKPTPTPENPPPTPIANVSFVTDLTLTGAPYHTTNLAAVVTIAKMDNSTVADEKMLMLDLSGKVKTESLQLPVGNYKLTRFRLVYGSVNTHFAAPFTGSTKAAGVQKPLTLQFSVSAAGGSVPVEVRNVNPGEGPQHFGYPAGSFDNHQEENNPYMKVKLKAIMQIGKVLYDSIPASLTLSTWNSQGEMTTTYLSLKAGVNEVQVLKAASKYRFHVSKWGTTDEMTLDRLHVDTATVYILGGSKDAKKLKSELTYALVNGSYLPESKTEYVYNNEGLLFRIYRYLRNAENKPYLSMSELFEYNGNQLEKISRYDDKNVLLGYTSFAYDLQGKVRSMTHLESGQQTNATVDYLYSPNPKVGIHYSYSGQTYTMDYEMSFSAGNILATNSFVAGQVSETGLYEHDQHINPYVHMNWPNFYLSNSSKNNVIRQYKTYQLHMPTAEPYDFSYTYDADGYPKELVKKFRSVPGYQHTKTVKTVFSY